MRIFEGCNKVSIYFSDATIGLISSSLFLYNSTELFFPSMIKKIFATALMLAGAICTQAQTYNIFSPELNIPVTINGNIIKNPWVGGFNTPLFSTIDMNGDGLKDLFVFDKDGGPGPNYRYTTYLNDGVPGQVSYTYAPEYAWRFPQMHDWALLYDFDCDGREDIFTYTYIGGMEVWHNDYNVTNGLSFSLYTTLIYSHYGSNYVNLYVSAVNLPALTDVDGDGDLDVLTFAISGNNVEYHRNYSMDSLGTCGLLFKLEESAWGHFYLSGMSNVAILGVAKPQGDDQQVAETDGLSAEKNGNTAFTTLASRHSGSCMIAVDFDGDNAKELMNGDILGNNMLYIYNGGTSDSAYMTTQDTIWPNYNTPVNFITFPAAYNFDVDNDGNKDIVISSCTANSSENFNNILFYRNINTNSNAEFNYEKNTLFQDEMIEVGSGANVALFDANNDGLKDLIIGNYGYFSPTPPYVSGLSYYRNTGTAASPAFELVTRDYMGTNSLGITGLYPAFGDIDGDGDDDMVLGCTDGFIQLYLNTAGPGNVPNFVMPVNGPNFLGIDVGLFSAPQLVDVDRDGKLDLLIGERQGNLNYYRNTSSGPNLNFTLVSSTLGNVDVVKHATSITGFSAPCLVDVNGSYELFVGSECGYIYHYMNIDNNLGGVFTLVDSMYKSINERPRITIAMADINNDGLTDIFTGNNEGGVKFYCQHVSAAGIPSLSTDNYVSLYPNPAVNELTVKFNDGASTRHIEIYALAGNLVYSGDVHGIQKKIEVRNLSNGMYLMKVTGNNKIINRKFIISH
jgi:hypothetical protein